MTYSSHQTVTFPQFLIAGALLAITIHAYLSWTTIPETRIPVWPLLCGVHFIYYGLAIFAAERMSPSTFDHRADLDESTLSASMLVGLVGLVSISIGRSAAKVLTFAPDTTRYLLNAGATTPLRIRLLLITGIAVNIAGVPFYGTGLWNVSIVLFTTIPMAAFLWLVLSASCRKLQVFDLVLEGAFFLTRLLLAARQGASLATIVTPVLLLGLAGIALNRRLPWRTVVAVTCVIVFLEPGKGPVRQQLAQGALARPDDILIEWVRASAERWAGVFSGEASLESRFSTTASRSSLLTLTGVILEKTPDVVPFQEGAGYPLLLANFVPRFLWPQKPTANLANRFFQLAYGLTDEKSLDTVSFASGFEAEGYMNFGWVGVIGASLFVGFAFRSYEQSCFGNHSATAATAIGLALLPGFLSIESQMVVYLGGILQIVLAGLLIFRSGVGR